MWHFAKWGLLRKALHICMSFQRTIKYSSFSLKSKEDKTVNVKKKIFWNFSTRITYFLSNMNL